MKHSVALRCSRPAVSEQRDSILSFHVARDATEQPMLETSWINMEPDSSALRRSPGGTPELHSSFVQFAAFWLREEKRFIPIEGRSNQGEELERWRGVGH
ncbi:hypothetical protein EYF80_059274 [Liparis tanakae]|uniref:Uncharacterized protein n=1 Tax=Liparis tanakae TaxID=230148 RepID=A0A4Z2ENR6_9TELE|nr:hypothetical protein EYF80_059274 [Liparis tanakae]